MKIFTDTHIAKAIAVQLRQNGLEVLRLEECSELPVNASDAAILTFAAKNGYSVLTHDDDFAVLHHEWLQAGKIHSGIFLAARYLQGQGGIGIVIKKVLEYHLLIQGGAGTDKDLQNQMFFII